MQTFHRMRTAHLQTVHSSVATTRCRSGGSVGGDGAGSSSEQVSTGLHCLPPNGSSRGKGWGHQVNKFEQVSSIGHQMSAAGGGGAGVPRSDVQRGRGEGVPGLILGGGMYSEVRDIMGNGRHMGTL